jgi:dihydroflavonol-4-reductase
MSGRAVVTGAAGFIGAHLARELVTSGHEVLAVDVQPRPPQLRLPGLRYEQADIAETSSLAALLANADVVYHLASAHLQVNAQESQFRRVNVRAAVELVTACADAGVRRLVHASTVGIYGHVSDPPAREDAPAAPGNMYERTKLEGEIAVVARASDLDVDVIVLRPAWVYGPGCRRTAKLLRSVSRGRFLYVGAGRNLRHPVYVSDTVAAFMLAAAAPPEMAGRDYIIAGPRPMELHELVERVAAAVGVVPPRRRLPRRLALALGRTAELAWGLGRREPPFSRRSLVFFENDNAFDTTAARRDLGFTPATDLDDGIRRTIEDPEWPIAL